MIVRHLDFKDAHIFLITLIRTEYESIVTRTSMESYHKELW